MKLRKLALGDAPLMLEWMHDPDVTRYLRSDFASRTLPDCERFIRDSWDTRSDLNLAITDESDSYMGTVSLKHLSPSEAEFAITVRSCAMGTGLAAEAMREILRIGTEELGLRRIYWCVSGQNRRAVRFYEKNGYRRTEKPEYAVGYTEEETASLDWFAYEA